VRLDVVLLEPRHPALRKVQAHGPIQLHHLVGHPLRVGGLGVAHLDLLLQPPDEVDVEHLLDQRFGQRFVEAERQTRLNDGQAADELKVANNDVGRFPEGVAFVRVRLETDDVATVEDLFDRVANDVRLVFADVVDDALADFVDAVAGHVQVEGDFSDEAGVEDAGGGVVGADEFLVEGGFARCWWEREIEECSYRGSFL
jgi:hypothetical protein